MSLLSSRLTSGRSRTPRTRLNMAALAPIPSASVRTTARDRPLARPSDRAAALRSRRNISTFFSMRGSLFLLSNSTSPLSHCKYRCTDYGLVKHRPFSKRSAPQPVSRSHRLAHCVDDGELRNRHPELSNATAFHKFFSCRTMGQALALGHERFWVE